MSKAGGVERIDTGAFDVAISEIENAKKAFESATRTALSRFCNIYGKL